MNGDNNIPATFLLASFVSNAKTAQLTPALKDKVKEIGVTLGALTHADSTAPIYAAINNLQGPTVTTTSPALCTVIGKGPPHFLPQYAGLLNAAFAHSLDFDDTYAEGTLHAGVTSISAALAQAEAAPEDHPVTSENFMLAVSVAYEVTCRLGRELGYDAYSRGFHNTSTAGIFGAIAAIAVLKCLNAQTISTAFGLAGSKAAGSMQYLENGSWNKRLHPGFAVHDAFMCVALAEAGVVGAAKILEGKNGFFKAYTPNPHVDLRRLVAGLGVDWCWLGSSLKPYPACRMTHAFIELAGNIYTRSSHPPSVDDFRAIQLKMGPANYILVGDPIPNKIHPTNPIDAQFSAYFQTACAVLYGAKTGDMGPYARLEDPAIHALADKISVEADETMTMGFAAKMRILWADGRVEESEQWFPLGELQHPIGKDEVVEKFFSLAIPVVGKERADGIVRAVEGLERETVGALVYMLR
ncbi:MAG: hypothetical protein FE78DRAFT_157438 [Acidomyces sp. 'richmondensis']|nr:MAG: hypothetical protein FE78DRAFT_157438 [Acidomyces sp. 'richmondensis']